MSVEVIVRCDVDGCDVTAPAPDPWADGEFADIGGHEGFYGRPSGWIDGQWKAPKGWTFTDDGFRCPRHRDVTV